MDVAPPAIATTESAHVPTPGAAPASRLHASMHLPALDGLRGLAILLVLFFHAPTGEPLDTVAQKLLLVVRTTGWTGVDLFFVLSGFLITGILFDARGTPHYYRNFYVRRGLRIFPLYYAYLAVVLLLLPALGVDRTPEGPLSTDGQWWLWAYAANIRAALAGTYAALAAGTFTGHFWSLAIEEQFYLFWPTVVRAFERLTLRRVAVGMVVAALAIRVACWLAGANSLVPYLLIFTRMDGFAVGCLIALAARGPNGFEALRRGGRVALLATAPVIAGLAVMNHRLIALDASTSTIGLTAIAVFWGGVLALVAAAPRESVRARVFGSAPMRWVGKYSYAIYVLHVPVNVAVYAATPLYRRWWLSGAIPLQLLYIALTTALTFLGAWLSWHVYEKHFLRLKRFFPYT